MGTIRNLKCIGRFSVCGLLAFLVTTMFAGQFNQVSAQPNIIHIVADDLGWTDLGTGLTNYGNGSAFYQTPNIDQLATQGLAFTSAYALQTCSATRAALFTGQYPTRTGTYNVTAFPGETTDPFVGAANTNLIANSTTTIAETLQTANYTTAHVGKFHISRTNPITSQHGFDFNFGGTNSGGPDSYFAAATGGQPQFGNATGPGLDPYAESYTQAYIDARLKPYANGADVDSLVGTPKHLTDAMADAAEDFLSSQAGNNAPFYMNLAFNAVHSPIEPRPDLHSKYQSVIAANGGTSPDLRHDNTAYAALLEGMDHAVGRLMAAIQDPNGDGNTSDSIADNTLVLFYGDNGGAGRFTNNAPLSESKGSLSEGGQRVPLIAWMPGTVASGVTDELVHPVDFYPTMAEFAGAALPDPATHIVDGHSFGSLLRGETSEGDRKANFFHLPGYTRDDPRSTVILDAGDNRLKLSYDYETRSTAVYDLNADIGESNNLANGNMGVLEYKLAAKATKQLRNWLDDTGAEYPTVRSDNRQIPPPDHVPAVSFPLGQSSGTDLQNETDANLTKLGLTLRLAAKGSNATFAADSTGIGIASALDVGSTAEQRRMSGELVIPESIEFSFDQDVYLKSFELAALSTHDIESVVLEYVSGDNPLTGLNGYDTDGFSLSPTTISFSASNANSSTFTLDFATNGQDEILLTAGTVMSLTANPAVDGGIQLNAISVAQTLDAVERILLDYNLDGAIDEADHALWSATFGSTSDLRADGNGNGIVDAADFTIWRDAFDQAKSAASVPETDCCVALLLGIFMAANAVRTRRSK